MAVAPLGHGFVAARRATPLALPQGRGRGVCPCARATPTDPRCPVRGAAGRSGFAVDVPGDVAGDGPRGRADGRPGAPFRRGPGPAVLVRRSAADDLHRPAQRRRRARRGRRAPATSVPAGGPTSSSGRPAPARRTCSSRARRVYQDHPARPPDRGHAHRTHQLTPAGPPSRLHRRGPHASRSSPRAAWLEAEAIDLTHEGLGVAVVLATDVMCRRSGSVVTVRYTGRGASGGRSPAGVVRHVGSLQTARGTLPRIGLSLVPDTTRWPTSTAARAARYPCPEALCGLRGRVVPLVLRRDPALPDRRGRRRRDDAEDDAAPSAAAAARRARLRAAPGVRRPRARSARA